MAPRTTLRVTVTAIAGIGAVGGIAVGLAACSAGATPGGPALPMAADTTFADGTYTATGHYISPGGPEAVTVTLTLADNLVTDVQVTSGANDPDAKQYQKQFIGGIAAVVVGKPLGQLQVDRVSGSSLTSGGFMDAVAQIEAQAAKSA